MARAKEVRFRLFSKERKRVEPRAGEREKERKRGKGKRYTDPLFLSWFCWWCTVGSSKHDREPRRCCTYPIHPLLSLQTSHHDGACLTFCLSPFSLLCFAAADVETYPFETDRDGDGSGTGWEPYVILAQNVIKSKKTRVRIA